MKYIAVDLGMGAEPTSIVVIEAKTWDFVEYRTVYEGDWVHGAVPFFRDPQGQITDKFPPPVFHLRHVDRLPAGTSYPEIVEKVRSLSESLTVSDLRPKLAIDITGVGKATADLFKGDRLEPYFVTVTGGDEVVETGMHFKVPKKDLISAAMVALQTDNLKIARDLPHGQLLIKELQTFRMNLSLNRSEESLSWRERPNDDLVLALAAALWLAKSRPAYSRGISYMRRKNYLFG